MGGKRTLSSSLSLSLFDEPRDDSECEEARDDRWIVDSREAIMGGADLNVVAVLIQEIMAIYDLRELCVAVNPRIDHPNDDISHKGISCGTGRHPLQTGHSIYDERVQLAVNVCNGPKADIMGVSVNAGQPI